MDAVVDRFVVSRKHEKAIRAGIAGALLVGDGLLQVHVSGVRAEGGRGVLRGLCSATHTSSTATSRPNTSSSTTPRARAVRAAGWAWTSSHIPSCSCPIQRSIPGGCFVREAFKYNPDTWDGRVMYSLAKGLGFSLDMPWTKLPEASRQAILYGIDRGRSLLRRRPMRR